MRILVAEDDQTTSKAECAMLRTLGHQPIPAFDAVQALMLAMRSPQPDAIVLDLNMPGGTGMGALEKLKSSSRTCEIPVIVLSGVSANSLKESAIGLGAVAFLQKPADADALKAALDGLGPA
ncbi:MAG TPA: response regulator [Gemmatimonadaceae bacterium]|nr:response regulator [Gemmatimonadaceae bacterium]